MLTLFPIRGIAYAICWTLIHSLWVGVLSAVLAGIIILCTRRFPVAVRYRLLLADLLLSVALIGGIFCREAAGISLTAVDPDLTTGNRVVVRQDGQLSITAVKLDRITIVANYLDEHATTIVSIWLLCLSFQLFRLLTGLSRLKRIRREAVLVDTDHWTGLVSELAARLGIRRKVDLRESLAIAVPAAVGIFKPLILVPVGMLAGMPADQVETILLHELAHIRRGDYWVNLVLHITDAIFFFNPALRWLSTLIRREREACCDDLVLLYTPDRTAYLEALVAFRERVSSARVAAYTVELAGDRNPLLSRVIRILTQENKTLNTMEKTILSLGLAAVITVGLLSMKPVVFPPNPEKANAVPASHVTVEEKHLIPFGKTDDDAVPMASAAQQPGGSPATNGKSGVARQSLASLKNVQIRAVIVFGDTVPASRVNRDSLMKVKQEEIQQRQEQIRKLDKEVVALQIQQQRDMLQAKKEELQVRKEELRKQSAIADNDKQLLLDKQKMALDQREKELDERMELLRTYEANPSREPIAVTGYASPRATTSVSSTNDATAYTKVGHAYAPIPSNDIYQRVIQDLVVNGLVTDQDELSFTLGYDKLMVNGKRVPAEIQKKLSEKYIKGPKSYIKYTHKKNATTGETSTSTDSSVE